MAGEEGVFFSVKNKLVGHQIYRGTGPKVTADFDQGPFPLFSIHDFKGHKNYNWHFNNFIQEQENGFSVIDSLENLDFDLGLEDLAAKASETENSFTHKIEQLQALAQAGEFWVINFTQDLSGRVPAGASEKLIALKGFYEFLKLDKNHCGGVVITKEQIFCSLSPETFLVQNKQALQTFPIKGTGSEAALKTSDKEKAELNMITDLMRNDLGQIGHQIWVERERYLTKESGFFHARAEVCGLLKTPALTHDAYKKLLPAGSISGAPKTRVVRLLKDLESFEREYYTGTFGVRLSPEKSIFNILIRTLFLNPHSHSWSFPVGSGITIESYPKAEWEETLEKAQILKACLKS